MATYVCLLAHGHDVAVELYQLCQSVHRTVPQAHSIMYAYDEKSDLVIMIA